jgi:hypothetical protein
VKRAKEKTYKRNISFESSEEEDQVIEEHVCDWYSSEDI